VTCQTEGNTVHHTHSSSPILILVACLACFLLSAPPVHAGIDSWSPIGPYGGTVKFLRFDPLHGGRVYAGTLENGVFRSDNGGTSWVPMNQGLPSYREIDGLVVTPTVPQTLYARSPWRPRIRTSSTPGDAPSEWSRAPTRRGPGTRSTATSSLCRSGLDRGRSPQSIHRVLRILGERSIAPPTAGRPGKSSAKVFGTES
jgi:hypothetical protein